MTTLSIVNRTRHRCPRPLRAMQVPFSFVPGTHSQAMISVGIDIAYSFCQTKEGRLNASPRSDGLQHLSARAQRSRLLLCVSVDQEKPPWSERRTQERNHVS